MYAGNHPGNPIIRMSEAQHQWDTPEFQNWFRGSKLVNSDGSPMRLYHGTSDNFGRFDLNNPGRKDSGWIGTGVYLTTSSALAGSYANLKRGSSPNVMPLYARVENPFWATIKDKQRFQLLQHARGNEAAREAADEWTQELITKGHDGVILVYTPEQVGPANASWEVCVFDPSAVKSATGNNGAFSDSDDLTEKVQPAVTRDQQIARAQALGFDTSKVWYHGTALGLEKIDPRQHGKNLGNNNEMPNAAWFSSNPHVAGVFADYAARDKSQDGIAARQNGVVNGQNIIPVHLRLKKPMIVDGSEWNSYRYMGGNKSFYVKQAKRFGYDGIIFRNVPDGSDVRSDIAAVFSAQNIRSIHARFSSDATRKHGLSERALDTPGFSEWFAGSVVVDADGQPRPVMHASSGEFQGKVFHPQTHFGTAKAANDRLAQLSKLNVEQPSPHIFPVYLSIKNPIRMGDTNALMGWGHDLAWRMRRKVRFDKAAKDALFLNDELDWGIYMSQRKEAPDYKQFDHEYDKLLIRELTRLGYDGIVYKNRLEDKGSDSYIIFRSDQVWPVFGSKPGTLFESTEEVLYHGSNEPNLVQFDLNKARTAKHIYTTPDPNVARQYGKYLYTVTAEQQPQFHLDPEFGIEQAKVFKQLFADIGDEYGYDDLHEFIEAITGGQMYQNHSSQWFQNAVLDEIFALGYRSIRMVDAGFGHGAFATSVIFADPRGIKFTPITGSIPTPPRE